MAKAQELILRNGCLSGLVSSTARGPVSNVAADSPQGILWLCESREEREGLMSSTWSSIP